MTAKGNDETDLCIKCGECNWRRTWEATGKRWQRQCRTCLRNRARERRGSKGVPESVTLPCAHCTVPFTKGYKDHRRLYCTSCLPKGSRGIIKARLEKYGVDHQMWLAMQFDQNGACAMSFCDSEATDVDHCHKTGRVRGLLCRRCNTRLSGIDDPEFLESALEYLG